MKKISGAVAITVLMLAQTLAAAAPSTAATTVTKVQTLGRASIALFNQTSGCIRTRVEVFANSSQVKGVPEPNNIVLVAVSRLNQCTNLSEIEGFGQTLEVGPTVAKDLSTSKLSTTLPFTNLVTGTSSLLTLDISWNATGSRVQTVSTDKFASEGIVISSKAMAASRQAEAVGSFTLGGETLLAPGTPSQTASIHQAITAEKTRDTGLS